MTPEQFIAKLVALVPPPRFHMTRYAGVFSNHHHLRPLIAPKPKVPEPAYVQLSLLSPEGKPLVAGEPISTAPSPRRIAWARLLARVFAIDVERCERCGGRMKMVQAVLQPDEIARHLHGARAPPATGPPGQLELRVG